MYQEISAIILCVLLVAGCGEPAPGTYELRVPEMPVTVDNAGAIQRIGFTRSDRLNQVKAFTGLRNCEPEGNAEVTKSDSQLTFRRKWVSKETGNAALVTDRFSRGDGSVRWDVEIAGLQGPWSTAIETHLVYPDSVSGKFWTAWGDPRLGELGDHSVAEQASVGLLPSDVTGTWSDPLLPIPFVNDTIWYGAPSYSYNKPRLHFPPVQRDLFGIPLVSISDEREGRGVSLVLSPADTLLDINLRIRSSGELVFNREYHRISSAAPVRFRMDIVSHESGWRGGLRWMAATYPQFFNPNIPQANEIAGTGAYSSLETSFDVEKMRKMAFGVNWKASFDFPYMGMFIPPVETDTTQWRRYGGGTTSIRAMSQYATAMKRQGFHVLSYFNVTEFGADVTNPPPPRKTENDRDLWKNADDFLYNRLADAILRIPEGVLKDSLHLYGKGGPGDPYYTWGMGIIMDPGEPVYQAFLLDQAEKHIKMLPDADGICIDRMDWLRLYNEQRDDGVSWFGNRPTRSLLLSWNSLMSKLGPLMHASGKVIFVNNHDKRIDLLRQTDGFFDEFTHSGPPLNLTALMGIRRPVLGWTTEEKNLRPDPDAFFQRFLYLGVYPMAPFPGNDHSLRPSPWVDRQYLDYGPLLGLMKGKKWVLEPQCVEALDRKTKVNLFEVPGGWIVPVTFGPKQGTVTVILRNVRGLAANLKASVVYPGSEKLVPVSLTSSGDTVRMDVGTRRGCALVKIEKGSM